MYARLVYFFVCLMYVGALVECWFEVLGVDAVACHSGVLGA